MNTSNPLATATHRRGFTLVELLVVIGIIALLISMLLPALNKARDSARLAQCLSNQRQLVTASHMYANQYKQFFPRAYSSPAFEYAWPTALKPFLPATVSFWKCPDDNSEHERSYRINYTRDPALNSADPIANQGPSGQKMTRVRGSSSTALFTCRQLNWNGAVIPYESVSEAIWYNAGEQLDPAYGPGYYYPPFVTNDIYTRPHSRNNDDSTVIAFCDGHVEKVFYPKPNDAAKWTWKWIWWE